MLRESSNGWRLVPVNKKERTEYALDKSDLNGGKHNELVVAEPRAGRIAGFGRVKVVERIGSMDSPKTISLIAIHDHGIPVVFPPAVIDEAKAAPPSIRAAAPICGPFRWSPSTRPMPAIMTMRYGPDRMKRHPGGHVVLVAIADVSHYVTPGSALDKEA